MKIEVTEKKDNKLLSRQEIKGVLTFNTATPSNAELEAALAKQLNVDKKCARAKKIATRYGESKADFLIYIYSSEQDLNKIEPAPIKWVEKLEKKAAAKKKAEESKEKPAEEAKEAPKEAKPEQSKEKAPAEKEKPAEKPKESKPEEKGAK